MYKKNMYVHEKKQNLLKTFRLCQIYRNKWGIYGTKYRKGSKVQIWNSHINFP